MVEYLDKVGRDIPDHYTPPEIWPGYVEWVEAFYDLSTDRHDLGPIPSASIARHTAGWDDWEAEVFKMCIRAMDMAQTEAMKDKEEGGLPQPPEVKSERPHGD